MDNGTTSLANESGNERCTEGTAVKNWHGVTKKRVKSQARLRLLVCRARISAYLNDHVAYDVCLDVTSTLRARAADARDA